MSERPNILVVITDHQRADSIGMVQCGREVMPRLNQFASESTVFTRAYTTAPLCIPARTAMATGQYPTSGISINDFSGREAKQQQLVTARLEEAGYNIAYVGKNDIRTRPETRKQHKQGSWIDKEDFEQWLEDVGLAEFPGWENRHDAFLDYFYKQLEEVIPEGPVTSRYSHPATGIWEGELENFRDFYFYHRMRDWLEKQAGKDAPFAAFFSIPSPHPPLVVPEPYASIYDPATISLPANVGMPAEGEPANRSKAVARQLAQDASEADHRKAWAAHLGLLTLADDIFGKLLDDLERLGLRENTLVIFTSDHGHHLGQHNMFGINELYEQTVHVPFIARLTDGHNGIFELPVSHLSIAPTLLELAGLPPDPGMPRQSLLPAIATGQPPPDEPQFFQFSGQIGYGYCRRGVVTRHYKYIYDPEDEPELYHLASDPLETTNLARLPEYSRILADHHALCRQWHERQGDWVDW
ncbi:MAG: sulfatase-like hydrolase/transferase [Puniceicoccaceae bacterium]